ncbi:hypothetical protein BH09ACT13_BH09ACT13_13560 [soil metagenome]
MQRTVSSGFVIALAAASAVSAIFLSTAPPAGGGELRAVAGPHGGAATFLKRVVGLVVEDRYARAWPSLYPAHKSVAPREEYIACELKTPVGSELRSADVLRVTHKLLRIPGESARALVTSVTLRLRIAEPSLGTEDVFAHTFNAVAVGSRWTWILTPSRYELYRSDACGT